MELVSFAKEVIQNVAEQAASYRLGQTALRHLDRALWVIEKCARWAVPPPLDQDERPQPELVRPLPWVFFLAMLITLRITRESISLVNLVLGKPPLRSADVVMYIQSKRRYLRTLKYQGSRTIRARGANKQPWYSGLQSLFEFTMCFRRPMHYGNNNTTRVSNNEEMLVIKRSKRTREPTSPVASTSEATMERLIERMMVDLDAASDADDSDYTLTNPTSIRSDRSEYGTGSEDDTLENLNESGNSLVNYSAPDEINIASSTPEKTSDTVQQTNDTELETNETQDENKETQAENKETQLKNKETQVENKETPAENKETSAENKETPVENKETPAENKETPAENTEAQVENHKSEPKKADNIQNNESQLENETVFSKVQTIDAKENEILNTDASPKAAKSKSSPKSESKNFLQNERCSPQKNPQKPAKFANGRLNAPSKKKGLQSTNSDSVTRPVSIEEPM